MAEDDIQEDAIEEEEEEEETAECSICGIEKVVSELSQDCSEQWEYVCGRCAGYVVTCWECDGEFIDTRAYETYVTPENGRVICLSCANEYYSSCSGCGCTYHNDRLNWSDESDEAYCSSCNSERSNSRVNSYSYKPDPKFRVSKKEKQTAKTWFAGIEVEINVPEGDPLDRYVEKVNNSDEYDLFYCKSDGSIGHGFEVVSHPVSWRWMQENTDWLNPFNALSRSGCVSYTGYNCGMHVHTPKDSYGPLMLKRIHSFIRLNPEFIRLFSNRTKGRLYEWANPECTVQVENRACKSKWNSDRFRALNLATDKTAEFRIFRGTISTNGIMRNIEFCHALWSHSQNTDKITTVSLWNFARQYRKIYPRMFEKMGAVMQRQAVIDEMARPQTIETRPALDIERQAGAGEPIWNLEFLRRYIPNAQMDCMPGCLCITCASSYHPEWIRYSTADGHYHATWRFLADRPVITTNRENTFDINTINEVALLAREVR